MVDKRWFLIGALVLGVLLFVVLLVPFIVNADSFRPTIESQLSGALGREVTMGKLSFSLMQGLVAEDIAIADDPAFSSVPFVQAKSLAIGIQLLPYFYHRQVRITKLTIDTPSMQLIEHSNGTWNYSSLGRSSNGADSRQQASVPDLNVAELSIINGSALVSSVPATAKPFEYNEVNLQVKELSLLKSFPFELSAKLPGGGTFKLTGNAGPVSQKDTSQTPFKAALQLRDFNPATSGLIDPSKGISMNNEVDAEIKSDGTNLTSSGKIRASQMQLAQRGSPAQEPVNIDYSISENLATREGNVPDVTIHTGSAEVHVKGSFKFSPEALMLDLRLSAPALPIEQVERLLPVVGIRLPSGSSLQGGTLTASVAITGPATSATVEGPIKIDNTRLAGYDLGSKIEGLNPLVGSGGGTEIRVLKGSLNSSAQGTRVADIYGDLPQLGTATGDGTLAPSGELDFHLIAKLNNANPNAKAAQVGSRSVPLTISGTATSPSIRANLGAMPR